MRYAIIFLTFPLVGCVFLQQPVNGYDYKIKPKLLEIEKNYSPEFYDGVKEPDQFPDLEENSKTLLGIDSNHDGVRDDVEIFINRTFKYDYERLLNKHFARYINNLLINMNKMTKEELRYHLDYERYSGDCERYLFGHRRLKSTSVDFVNSELLLNTQIRVELINKMYDTLKAGDSYKISMISHDSEGIKYCPSEVLKVIGIAK